jgi:bifunctional oligoribonuclease and PAP phosphatase NrnA
MTVVLSEYTSDVPDEVVRRIAASRRVLAVSHENPDADTLGSSLAVCRIVEALGGSATPVCTDPVPALYGFIPGMDRFRTDPDPDLAYDLLVVSDCGSFDRVGAVAERHPVLFAELPRVVIDHHASNDQTGAADWIEPTSAATCEMTAVLSARLGVPLELDGGALATALMAGIVMDTATFAHPNSTPRTLIVSAALVEAGAPLSEISRRLYRSKPAAQVRLFGRVLERFESSLEGRLVWATILDADLAAAGAIPAYTEGIIDLLSQVDTADVAIVFKEHDEGTRLSVRTHPNGVDATVLTGRFGGGGHARAAGATIRQPLDVARPLVLAEAERLIRALGR